MTIFMFDKKNIENNLCVFIIVHLPSDIQTVQTFQNFNQGMNTFSYYFL